MRVLIGSFACLLLVVLSSRVEAQEEKPAKAETKPKGVFVTTVGTHKLHEGRVTLKVEEKDGKVDTYVTQGETTWGPVNPRPKKNTDWFLYSESPDEVWWFDGDRRLYVFPYFPADKEPGRFGRGGVSQIGGKLMDLVPKEVLDRLPKAFKESEAAEAKKDAEAKK